MAHVGVVGEKIITIMQTSETGKEMRELIDSMKENRSKITAFSDKQMIRNTDDSLLSEYLSILNEEYHSLTNELEDLRQIIIEEKNRRNKQNKTGK
jgi:predicted nuclease with TOPRIM domain